MVVGRHAECARLESVIAATRAGAGEALLLRGVPGAGKTALLEFVAGRDDDLTVLRAAGVPGETEVAFAGLHEALRPVLPLVGDLPKPQRAALSGALGLMPAVEGERFLVGAATLGLLLLASATRAVLVCVDDAQWLDGPSLDALLFTSRRLAGAPVGMVLTARDEPVPGLDAARLAEMPVGELDRVATGLLASELIGKPLDAGSVNAIFATTQGLPLAVTEWSRLGDVAGSGAAPVPVSKLVERAYAKDVEAAAKPVRAFLLIAAADDSGELATVLAAAERAGVPGGAAEGAEALGFLDVADGRVRFRHPLVRSAIYQSATAPQRRRAHQALSASLTGEWQADRRAWHRAAGVAEPDEDIAADLASMARRARARSGYAVAARALERAAALTPSAEDRAQRAIAAAQDFWRAGRVSHAEQLIASALERTTDDRLRADAEHLLGRMTHFRGDGPAAFDILADAALRVEPADARRAAVLMAGAMHASWFCLRPDRLRSTAAETARLAVAAGADDDPELCALTGAALTVCDRLEAAAPFLRRSIALATGADPQPMVFAAMSHGWLCEYAAARDLAARALEAAHELAAPGSVAFANEMHAQYLCALGDYDGAAAVWTETIRMAEATEQVHMVAWSKAQLAYIAAQREPGDAAIRLVDEAHELGDPLWFMGATASSWVRGTSALACGDAEAAASALAGTELDVCQVGYDPWTVGTDLAEARLRAGDAVAARETLDRLAPHACQPWARAALYRARGLVAADDGFDAPMTRAVDAFARLGVRVEEARSRLCHGERLRRAGRRVEARTQLRAALGIFERLGCAPWIARTEHELRASGETLRVRRPRDGVEDLTPQERQVAMLAAAGLTNKEAAARLFLSVKTIEAHLHRTYRKLGIHSRSELGPLIGSRG
jgi:DNA-binding CsgD family transcriptional regulator